MDLLSSLSRRGRQGSQKRPEVRRGAGETKKTCSTFREEAKRKTVARSAKSLTCLTRKEHWKTIKKGVGRT